MSPRQSIAEELAAAQERDGAMAARLERAEEHISEDRRDRASLREAVAGFVGSFGERLKSLEEAAARSNRLSYAILTGVLVAVAVQLLGMIGGHK